MMILWKYLQMDRLIVELNETHYFQVKFLIFEKTQYACYALHF